MEHLTTYLSQFFERDVLDRSIAALSSPPSVTTLRVNTLASSVDSACDAANKALQPRGLTARIHPVLPDCLCIPVASTTLSEQSEWQSLCGSAEIVVDQKCGEAVLRGSDIYAIGCKAATLGIEAGGVVAVSVDLDGAVLRGTSLEPETGYCGRKLFIGIGTTELSRKGIFAATEGVAVRMTQRLYGNHPPSHLFDDRHLVMVNEPSMVCAHALGPSSGECILDMCAAPGGKTSHVAALMGDSGVVLAMDRSRNRALKVAEACTKLGLRSVMVAHGDSTKIACVEPASETLHEMLSGYQQEQNGAACYKLSRGLPLFSFDRILLDPPCSGLGQRPKLNLHAEFDKGSPLAQMHDCAGYQKALIRAAVPMLKVGGVMTYSTCTLNPEENEGNVAYLLEQFPQMRLTPCPPYAGGAGIQCCGLGKEEARLVQRFMPGDQDSIAFFLARFEKVC